MKELYKNIFKTNELFFEQNSTTQNKLKHVKKKNRSYLEFQFGFLKKLLFFFKAKTKWGFTKQIFQQENKMRTSENASFIFCVFQLKIYVFTFRQNSFL